MHHILLRIQFKNTVTEYIPYTFFQFESLVKTYGYHYLYSWSDFLADLGGYLGLFLGISAFTVVEIVERTAKAKTKAIKRRDTIETVGRQLEDMTSRDNRPIIKKRSNISILPSVNNVGLS